jgi:uncharacterized membrane protein
VTVTAPIEPSTPSRDDPTVRRASSVIGGPLGRYAGASARWWTPIRVLLALTAFTLLLGYGQKSPCADGRWEHSLQYTHACYSDIIPLWAAEGLADGAVPYRDHAVEYPVVTGGFMWITAELTHGWHALALNGWLPGKDNAVIFGLLTCVLLAVAGLFTVAATAGAAGAERRWDAAIFAASPLLIFHAFTNWDLLAMAFMSGALWAWAQRRPVLTGVLIGLGTGAKLYPALLLIPLFLLAYRSRTWRPAVWAAISAVAVWLAVNLPVAFSWSKGWGEFYAFNGKRGASEETLWFLIPRLTNDNAIAHPSTSSVVIATGLAIIGIGWLALRAPTTPRLAQLVFLVVAAFLLTSKVWSAQYSIWLVPLIALARPKWRLALLYQASEIAVWIGKMLLLLDGSDPNKALTYQGFTVIVMIRDAILLLLIGLVVREVWRPDLDPVRARPDDDLATSPSVMKRD